MSQKLGASSGSAARTASRTARSRPRSWAVEPVLDLAEQLRGALLGGAVGRPRLTRLHSSSRARAASAWMASAGWFASSLPRSASIWMTRPRGRNVW